MKHILIPVFLLALFLLSWKDGEIKGVKELTTIDSIVVKLDTINNVLYFISGMNIDADGSPHAYHPVSDSGLDKLSSGGYNTNWSGILALKGVPIIQGENDPAPGFYVSPTSLQDVSKQITDPLRYVNSETIPYFVLPNEKTILGKIKTGDVAYVCNLRNRKTAYAIFADVGPKDKIGEGSIALAKKLGIDSSPRTGGIADSVLYYVFPGSGNGRPRTVAEIDSVGKLRYGEFMGRDLKVKGK